MLFRSPHLLGVDMSTFLICMMKIYCAYNMFQRFLMHFRLRTSVIRCQPLPNHGWILSLEYGYAFKAYKVDTYSSFIGCIIYHMCDCPYSCQLVTCRFVVYTTHTTCSILRCNSTEFKSTSNPEISYI